MLRGLVIYKCGAEAEVLYPEGDPGALERLRAQLLDRDCPYCLGDERQEGWELSFGRPGAVKGSVSLWHWRDVTDGRSVG